MTNFYVKKDVLDSGVKILFAIIRGMNNKSVSDEWLSYRNDILKNLFEEYKDLNPKEDLVLEGFNILHDNTGVKRRKNIPSSENLIKLFKKNNGEIHFINQIVDIYNLLSLKSKLSLGAHDLSKVEGNVTLRFTDGTEKFDAIGSTEAVVANPHEYSYIDDSNEVLCRLEIRQVKKTAVNENTTDVFFIVEGNEFTSDDYVYDVTNELILLVTKYCGGKGEIIKPKVI